MNKSHKRMALAILTLVAMAFMAWAIQAQCYDYPNSRVGYVWGQATCAYTGTHCIECVAGGGSCFGDLEGNSECVMHDVP